MTNLNRFKLELNDDEIFDKVVKNRELFENRYNLTREKYKTPSDFLRHTRFCGFLWRNTEEGVEFWDSVCKKLDEVSNVR